MPIWTNPPRKLFTAFKRVRDDARNRGQQSEIEFMPVDAINADSSYEVGDVQARVPATGTAQDIRVGERVPVATINGQPIAIFAHSARRAQFHPPAPLALGTIIEELFLSGDQNTGIFDVYFRNFDQVTKLGLSAHVAASNPPGSIPTSFLAWGSGTDRFLLGKSQSQVRVFKLNRRSNIAYTSGQKARATLEVSLDPTTVGGSTPITIVTSLGTVVVNVQFRQPWHTIVQVSTTHVDGGASLLTASPPSLTPQGGLALTTTAGAPGSGDLAPNTTFYYIVVALAGFTEATAINAVSDIKSITTPDDGGDPTQRIAVSLSWNAIPDSNYFVYRALSPTFDDANRKEIAKKLGDLIDSSAQTLFLDERGHVISQSRLDITTDANTVPVTRARDMIVDLMNGSVLLSPTELNFTIAGCAAALRTPPLEFSKGKLVQHAIFRNEAGNQVASAGNTKVTFIRSVNGASVFSKVLLDEPAGSVTHQIMLQASRAHLLWAVASRTNPFGSLANVLMKSLPFPEKTPPILEGLDTQVGTTLSKFFFSTDVDTYGNPLELLRPFDVLWATVTVDGITKRIISELLFPVVVWKSGDPSSITLRETDPNFPPKDTVLVRITGLKKLPTGVVIVGSTITPAVQVFQAINDAAVLAIAGRRATT